MTDQTTFKTYNGDGVTRDFSVGFSYNKSSELVVTRKNGVATYTLLNPNTIRLSAPLATGDVLTIQRVTDISKPDVVWKNGSSATGSQLNTMVTQLLRGMQEARDTADRGLFVLNDGAYNFQGFRAGGLGEPLNDDDAATKKWVETAANSNVVAAINAAESANTAKNAAVAANDAAQSAKGVAQSSSMIALSAKDTAEAKASEAASYATAAQTARTQAQSSAGTASSAATTAGQAKDEAITARDAAIAARDAAQGSANTASSAITTVNSAKTAAQTAATNASNSATAAAGSATSAANSASSVSANASAAVAAKTSAESARDAAQGYRDSAASSADAASSSAATAVAAKNDTVAAKDAALAAVAGITAQEAVIKGQGIVISGRNLLDLGSPYGNSIPLGAWGDNVGNAPSSAHHSFIPFSTGGNPDFRAAFAWGWYGDGDPNRVRFINKSGGTWGNWETLAFLSDLQKSKEYVGDLNNLKTGGAYFGGNGGLVNHPGDGGMWNIEVRTSDDVVWVTQRAVHWWAPLVYERKLLNGETWTSWDRVWSDGNNPAIRYDTAQSLTSAQITQARKNIGFIDAWSLGLRPDGTDMSSVISNILTVTNNVVVTVPGRYVFSSNIVVGGRSIAIVGAPGVEFYFNGATQGFEHTITTGGQVVCVMDVLFRTSRNDATGVRVKVDPAYIGLSGRTPEYGFVPNRSDRTVYLRNLTFVGDSAATGWFVGAWLTSTQGPKLEFITATGRYDVPYGSWIGTAIRLDGRGMPTGGTLFDIQVFSYDVAFQFPDYIEGVTIDTCSGVNVNYGIQAVWLPGVSVGDSQAYQWALGFFVSKIHFSAYDRCIWMHNVVQSRFTDLNLYINKRPGKTSFVAIEIGHGLDSTVTNLTVNAMADYSEANGMHGLIMHDCYDWVVSKVNSYRATHAVWITDGGDNNRIDDVYSNMGKHVIAVSASSLNCDLDKITGRNLTHAAINNASSSTTVGAVRNL